MYWIWRYSHCTIRHKKIQDRLKSPNFTKNILQAFSELKCPVSAFLVILCPNQIIAKYQKYTSLHEKIHMFFTFPKRFTKFMQVSSVIYKWKCAATQVKCILVWDIHLFLFFFWSTTININLNKTLWHNCSPTCKNLRNTVHTKIKVIIGLGLG